MPAALEEHISDDISQLLFEEFCFYWARYTDCFTFSVSLSSRTLRQHSATSSHLPPAPDLSELLVLDGFLFVRDGQVGCALNAARFLAHNLPGVLVLRHVLKLSSHESICRRIHLAGNSAHEGHVPLRSPTGITSEETQGSRVTTSMVSSLNCMTS